MNEYPRQMPVTLRSDCQYSHAVPHASASRGKLWIKVCARLSCVFMCFFKDSLVVVVSEVVPVRLAYGKMIVMVEHSQGTQSSMISPHC